MHCAACGHANREQAKFCDECGQPLGIGPRRVDPRGYVPPEIAERIARSRAALVGERKQVTVLFADVQNSMLLAERLGPEEWRNLIDRVFHLLNEGVHRMDGTVNQYTGDGIMALFGAPLAHEHHAERACHAALDLCRRLRTYSEELRRTRGLELSMRFGMNSGEVVVGTIGDDLRMEYTAQGHTVGLAQRVEQLAAPDTVYLSHATARLVADAFELTDLGPFTLKGASEPVRIYRLDGAKPLPARIDAVLGRAGPRLVARDRELGVLQAALAQASAGRGQVIGLVGEPGVGKTRLCVELVRRAEGVVVAQAHCPAHAPSVPWLPLRELVRSLLDLDPAAPAEASRRRVRRALLRLGDGFRALLPLAYDFLEIGDTPLPPATAEERREEVVALLRRLVQAQSAASPLLLFIDDLHCIDADGDALLAEVVDALAWTRTLLLVNFRPGFRAVWMRPPVYRELALAPLDDAGRGALLRALVGDHPSTAELRTRIGEHTGGNPFFAEQVVQALIERGVLVPGGRGGRRRSLRAAGGTIDLAIPPTVQALLAARLDRLPAPQKLVIQAAAVIGNRFAPPVLSHVLAAELDSAAVDEALTALERAELICRGEDEYAFCHPLTQAVTYAGQLADARARLHLAVARALQALHTDRLGQCAGLLAHHFAAANWRFEAERWRRRAALRVTGIALPRSQRP